MASSLPALRVSVEMYKLMRKRTGRKVPKRTAKYAPNWTSRDREVDGRLSTMESIAKAGAVMAATGTAAAPFTNAALVTATIKQQRVQKTSVFNMRKANTKHQDICNLILTLQNHSTTKGSDFKRGSIVSHSSFSWTNLPEAGYQTKALTLRHLVRCKSHRGGNEGEEGKDLEGLHGDCYYRKMRDGKCLSSISNFLTSQALVASYVVTFASGFVCLIPIFFICTIHFLQLPG